MVGNRCGSCVAALLLLLLLLLLLTMLLLIDDGKTDALEMEDGVMVVAADAASTKGSN
jgi:hypothetical protein